MKKCIGLIVNRLDDKVSLMDFLLNARRFGQTIDEVIIIYSQEIDRGYLENIRTYSRIRLIHVNRLDKMFNYLISLGIPAETIETILNMENFKKTGLITYSKKRNLVLLQALIDEMDLVYFIDSDVHPCVLYHENSCEEIDFIGEHLAYITMNNVAATTSDYSGYFILPPMKFDGMHEFLKGIQKESAIAYMETSKIHNCLKLGLKEGQRQPFFSNKLLGGNLCMRTDKLKYMPPFFSFFYEMDERYYLTRGEDTTMGLFIEQNHLRIIDIDVKIIHDTFGTYPQIPDLERDILIKNRLYYASMGWIGRNPFLNYLQGANYREIAAEQSEALKIGGRALSEYTGDDRFLNLSRAVECALENLPYMIERYEKVRAAWHDILIGIERSRA